MFLDDDIAVQYLVIQSGRVNRLEVMTDAEVNDLYGAGGAYGDRHTKLYAFGENGEEPNLKGTPDWEFGRPVLGRIWDTMPAYTPPNWTKETYPGFPVRS